MNEVSIDQIVRMVVREVIQELEKNNVRIVYSTVPKGTNGPGDCEEQGGFRTKKEKIDMSAYKSPVLTENHINRLHDLTGEIIVPRSTVVTPKAKQALKSKNIALIFET